MSAILAILLMLTGTLSGVAFMSPIAHAVMPAPANAGAIVANVSPLGSTNQYIGNLPYKAYPAIVTLEDITGMSPGQPFEVFVDVINVTQLFGYQVGFKFDNTILQIINATGPGQFTGTGTAPPATPYFDSKAAPVDSNASDATVNSNATGLVPFQGFSLKATTVQYSENGSGVLMKVWFMINPSYAGTYTDTSPGHPVPGLMNFSVTQLDDQTIFLWTNGKTKINPNNLLNGTLVQKIVYVAPYPPTAESGSVATVYVGTPSVFTAENTSATAGWNGTAKMWITAVQWQYPAGTPIGSSLTLSYTFPSAGTYHVTLIVWAIHGNYDNSSSEVQIAIVIVKPTGCGIDFYTQDWRYIDPYYIATPYTGSALSKAPGLADSFRPGDLVELDANVTYNGAPVQGALVTFQVWDNHNETFAATAISNCYGLATWQFRIPWPSTPENDTTSFPFNQTSVTPVDNTTLFGMWRAMATWQLGSEFTERPPYEKTQNATLWWDVSWGLSISIASITPNPAVRGPDSCGYGSDVVVKVNVCNEYLVPVYGLVTVTLFDNLLVPIYPTAKYETAWPAGTASVVWTKGWFGFNATAYKVNPTCTGYNLTSIEIPSYAFVGTAYAVANLLSDWPINLGTAFCPPALADSTINAGGV